MWKSKSLTRKTLLESELLFRESETEKHSDEENFRESENIKTQSDERIRGSEKEKTESKMAQKTRTQMTRMLRNADKH